MLGGPPFVRTDHRSRPIRCTKPKTDCNDFPFLCPPLPLRLTVAPKTTPRYLKQTPTVRAVKPGHLKMSPLTSGGVTILPSPLPVSTPTSPVLPSRTNHIAVERHGNDEDEEKRRLATMEEDPDFDPDNMVIRGAPLEETTDDEA